MVVMQILLQSSSEVVVMLATRLLSLMRPVKGTLHVVNWLPPRMEERWMRRMRRREKRWKDILLNFTCSLLFSTANLVNLKDLSLTTCNLNAGNFLSVKEAQLLSHALMSSSQMSFPKASGLENLTSECHAEHAICRNL